MTLNFTFSKVRKLQSELEEISDVARYKHIRFMKCDASDLQLLLWV